MMKPMVASEILLLLYDNNYADKIMMEISLKYTNFIYM